MSPAENTALAPRAVSISTLFFKSLAGLGAGTAGAIILLIFIGLGLAASGGDLNPFASFSLILMGLVAALAANALAVFFFGVIDPAKHPNSRLLLRRVVSLNLVIFLFLLPAYLAAATFGKQAIFLVAVLQLVGSAQATALTLELAAANRLGNLLSVYGTTFALLATIILNAVIFLIFDESVLSANPADIAIVSQGLTALLFAILPITWFCFGFFTSLTEMLYRWIYLTWGANFLSRE